jgi:hypothetical protein
MRLSTSIVTGLRWHFDLRHDVRRSSHGIQRLSLIQFAYWSAKLNAPRRHACVMNNAQQILARSKPVLAISLL